MSTEAAAIDAATRHQPGARAALTAGLERPSHAYLLTGPRGSGKRAAARAFVGEILAAASEEPADARRRAHLDPSPHPDLVWIRPPGVQHLVEEVREQVIAQAHYRPFEGDRRVFVVEAAEAMADESQNALLKTLEEPPSYMHLVLLSSEPSALLDTVISRCQPIRFAPLPAEAILEQLGDRSDQTAEPLAAARLSAGDAETAAYLLSGAGRELRRGAEDSLEAARAGLVGAGAWRVLLKAAEREGEEAAARIEAEVLADAPGESRRNRRSVAAVEAERRRLTSAWRSAGCGRVTSPLPARACPSWPTTRTGSTSSVPRPRRLTRLPLVGPARQSSIRAPGCASMSQKSWRLSRCSFGWRIC